MSVFVVVFGAVLVFTVVLLTLLVLTPEAPTEERSVEKLLGACVAAVAAAALFVLLAVRS